MLRSVAFAFAFAIGAGIAHAQSPIATPVVTAWEYGNHRLGKGEQWGFATEASALAAGRKRVYPTRTGPATFSHRGVWVPMPADAQGRVVESRGYYIYYDATKVGKDGLEIYRRRRERCPAGYAPSRGACVRQSAPGDAGDRVKPAGG